MDFLVPGGHLRRGQPCLPDELFAIVARYYWGGGLSAEEEAAAAAEAAAAEASEGSAGSDSADY